VQEFGAQRVPLGFARCRSTMEKRHPALLSTTTRQKNRLGKLMLYQLSYVRAAPILAAPLPGLRRL